MHGQFYTHPHYLQRASVPQNSSAGIQRSAEQQGQLRFTPQQGIINGQPYQTRSAQQSQQPQSIQAPELTQYAQLLQNQNYQVLYSQALQQEQNRQQQEQQQRLLQQQRAAQNEQSLRSLLSPGRYRMDAAALSHIHHLQQLDQFAQQSMSPHHLGAANLQHAERLQQAAKTVSHYQDDRRQRVEQQRIRQDDTPTIARTHPQNLVTSSVRNLPLQNSTPQDILRHISPTTPGRSPPGYARNPNMVQNLLLSPQANPGLISPHRNAFSPALGQIAASRIPMTRGDIGVVPEHNAPPLQQGTYGNNVPVMSRTLSQDLQSPRISTPAGSGVTKTNIHVKRRTPSVNSTTAPVIVVDTDSEDDDDQQPSTSDRTKKDSSSAPANNLHVVIDDDIEITGFKEAEIMSHMRPDCPIHTFTRIDSVSQTPEEQNVKKCAKCYCYICDKLASECQSWSLASGSHCNAHAKASCWKARRNAKRSPLMMKIPQEDITQEMSTAGDIAMQYMIRIRERYITYRAGMPCDYSKVPCVCTCHRQRVGPEPCMSCKVVHDAKKSFNYEPVREETLGIIREIEAKDFGSHPTMPLIMLEAVLSELCTQRPADFNHTTRAPSNPDARCHCNFPNIIEQHIEKDMMKVLTSNQVDEKFVKCLNKCVEEAIKPLQLKDIMKRFLTMRHWHDLLLRAVLTGSNIVGSKSRDVLRETPDVIKMRVDKLDNEKRYQSILRYLKAVKLMQSSKSSVSNKEIMIYMDQWKFLYAAKQGQFKETVIRMLEPVHLDQNLCVPGTYIAGQTPEFLLQLLDALSGKFAQQNTRLDSFDPTSSQGPHIISGRDADILLVLFQFILIENQHAMNHIPCYLWLANWVNRMPLTACFDPAKIQLWYEQATEIIKIVVAFRGSPHTSLNHFIAHDPHVHIFVATLSIVNAVAKFPNAFKTEELRNIIDAYKNNEWALFFLATHPQMMNLRDFNIFRWIIKFCDTSPGIISHFKDRIIFESISSYSLDDVTEFLKSLIKPEWVNSSEAIQRIAIASANKYSARLLSEATKQDWASLEPKEKWLETTILKNVEEQKIMPHLLRSDAGVLSDLKNISKVCSFLNPVRRNIDLYHMISPPAEWPRRCSQLIQYLVEKVGPERTSGTVTEFSMLLWLLWITGDLEQLGSHITHFIDRHSCMDNGSKLTSPKVVEEVANLLDSSMSPELLTRKQSLVFHCKRLFTLETLSWLTCTDCATKMSSGWTKIWISISKSKLTEILHQLNEETLGQFKNWLNKIPLDNQDNYKRLMSCLRTFLHTLVVTWKQCGISYEDAGTLLEGVAGVVADVRFKRDISTLSRELIQAEVDKLKPKAPAIEAPVPAPQPQNNLSQNKEQPRPQPTNHRQIPQRTAPTSSRPATQLPPPKGVKELDSMSIKSPPSGQQTDNSSERSAVMSPGSLYKRKTQNNVVLPQKLAPDKEQTTPKPTAGDNGTPFSQAGLSRTKQCQNCGETISRAAFKCPKCNQSSRQTRTVTCPSCGQENRELKGYSCKFCYSSLINVLFGGEEHPPVSDETSKSESDTSQKKKRKSSDKRRKKSKNDAMDEVSTMPTASITTVTTVTSSEVIQPEPPPKATRKKSEEPKIPPITLKRSNKSSIMDDLSDSSSEDFIVKETPKKRKRTSSNPKSPVMKSKRRPSIRPPPGESLTDSDSDSETEKAALITPVQDPTDITTKNFEKPILKSPIRPNKELILAKSGSLSPRKISQDRANISKPAVSIPKPQISIPKQRITSTDGVTSPQRPNSTHNTPPLKRGVGHSSMMSKKQKNILSRLKRPGMGAPKFPTPPKTTTVNPRVPNKDPMRSPPMVKRNSLDNGGLSSPGTHSGERQRHDSSCSSSSVGSGSGLSFGLAKVKPRNVGHRTGGPPGQRSKPRDNPSSSMNENPKNTLFPQPLNHNGEKSRSEKSKKKKKKRELLVKMPSVSTKKALEKKLNVILRRRKPGPASRSNYRKILKLERKLRNLQRPNHAWRLPSNLTLPNGADLSLYARVSLSLFPRDRLRKIQSLVPSYRLYSLYA